MPGNHPWKRYEKVKKIGQGTYGSVTKAFDTHLNDFVAIKKLKFQQDEQTIPVYAMRQIASLKQLQHPGIIKVYQIKYEAQKKKLNIVFEFIEQTLEDYMQKTGPLSPFSVKLILHQLLSTLKYIETRGFMHRDLKPQNIMIKPDGKMKLIDFGQTKKISFQNLQPQKQTLEVSTLWYKAPELLLGNQFYTNKIEIWSVGCIFAEMLTGKPLFSSTTQIEQIFQIFEMVGTPRFSESKMMRNWQYVSPSFPKFEKKQIQIPLLEQQGNNLLRKMMVINPAQRISISEALHHPYFEGLE